MQFVVGLVIIAGFCLFAWTCIDAFEEGEVRLKELVKEREARCDRICKDHGGMSHLVWGFSHGWCVCDDLTEVPI